MWNNNVMARKLEKDPPAKVEMIFEAKEPNPILAPSRAAILITHYLPDN